MAAHNSRAAKIQQNKLSIDCATSNNFVYNLIDLNVKTLTSQLMRAKTVTTYKKSCLEHENISVVNNTTGSTKKKKNNDLFLVHFSVRSLQKHIDQLNNYLVGFKNQPDIVALSETKFKEGLINRNTELEG